MFKKDDGSWELKQYMISTVPGLEFTITDSWLAEKNLTNISPWVGSSGKKIFMKEYAKTAGTVNGDPNLKNGLPILVPSQYIDLYYLSQYKGAKAFLTINGATQLVWRDNDTDNPDVFNPNNYSKPELITPNVLTDNGLKFHLGYPGGQKVGNWSEGSQVFSNADNLNEFFGYCEKHKEKYDNKFTYTLATKNDWDEAVKAVDANKTGDNLSPTQSQTVQSATQSSAPQPSVSNLGGTQSSTQGTGTQSSTQGTGTQGTTQDNTQGSPNSNPTEFTIAILNAVSEAGKKISGRVNITKQGPLYTATGIISGFPDGATIGPISGQPTGGGSEVVNSLVQEMLRNLESLVISKYQVETKLVVVDKK
jgi:hypothetical protein